MCIVTFLHIESCRPAVTTPVLKIYKFLILPNVFNMDSQEATKAIIQFYIKMLSFVKKMSTCNKNEPFCHAWGVCVCQAVLRNCSVVVCHY